jgi:hypothetical protein
MMGGGPDGPVPQRWRLPFRLRSARDARGLSCDEVARLYRRLATWHRGRSDSVGAAAIREWELGLSRPNPRQLEILALVFDEPKVELLLADMTPVHDGCQAERPQNGRQPGTDEEDDLKRRRFGMYLAALGGASVVDPERLAALLVGLRSDGALLDDLQQVTANLSGRFYSEDVDLLPAARSHLDVLMAMLTRPQPGGHQSRLQLIAGQTAALACWTASNLHRLGEAYAYGSMALDLTREVGDTALYAQMLIARSWSLSSTGLGAVRSRDQAIGLLNDAESAIWPHGAPLVQMWIAARRAEEHACLGRADACWRDLEAAGRYLAVAQPGERTICGPQNATHLDAFRGSCALLLGHASEATRVLEDALRDMDLGHTAWRSIVLADLAMARVLERDVEAATLLLWDSLFLAMDARAAPPRARIRSVREKLAPWQDHRSVRLLDDQLRQLQ